MKTLLVKISFLISSFAHQVKKKLRTQNLIKTCMIDVASLLFLLIV